MYSKLTVYLFIVSLAMLSALAQADKLSGDWLKKWPKTNFTKHLDKAHQVYPAPGKNIATRLPLAIDNPSNKDFQTASQVKELTPAEPVITVVIENDVRAYPINTIVDAHIVNDTIANTPVLISFCVLCNSSVVFDRRVDNRSLEFDTSYLLLDANLVMFDRQTESWWPQLMGEGIAGEMTGKLLDIIPTRIESFESFRNRYPNGKVLILNGQPIAKQKFSGYGKRKHPLYKGKMPEGIDPFMYLVTVGNRAWSMDLLREKKRIVTDDDIVITWSPNLESTTSKHKKPADIDHGNVLVQRKTNGGLIDMAYGLEFAFAFLAFNPDAEPIVMK